MIIPSKVTKIFEFNQHKKCDKAPFIIQAYLECLIEKIDECKNNPGNSIATKVGEHRFSAEWLRSSVVSILISLISGRSAMFLVTPWYNGYHYCTTSFN